MSVTVTECVLCGDSNSSVLAEHENMTWVKCDCGLIYKQKYESPEEVADRFDEDYFEKSERSSYASRTNHRIAKSRWQILDLLNYAEPGPLLDIGCSVGYTLQAARQLGLEASGLDISEYAVEECRKNGLDARTGKLDALPFEDSTFQLVTMKHVLEHTPIPTDALAEVKRVLKDTGAVFIAVPNGGYARSKMDPQNARFFHPSGPGHDHFIYYTPDTLTELLEKNGFKVARVHPHVLHKRSATCAKLFELITAPLKLAWLSGVWRLGLRKEFWLVAMPGL